jgi:hypothetical protein
VDGTLTGQIVETPGPASGTPLLRLSSPHRCSTRPKFVRRRFGVEPYDARDMLFERATRITP